MQALLAISILCIPILISKTGEMIGLTTLALMVKVAEPLLPL
jgi:hypothetical protein